MELDVLQTGERTRKHTRIISSIKKQSYTGIRSTIKKKSPTLSLPIFSACHRDLRKSVTAQAKKLAMQYKL